MTEIIFDCNNWLRRRCERGSSLKTCFAEVAAHPGAVLVFDGDGALKRRRAIYPEYKAGRPMMGSDMAANFELFEKLTQFLPVIAVRVPGWEADDVIATLARQTNVTVQIMSTDADFLQLPNAVLPERQTQFPCEGSWVHLYKAVVGDKSDNIPGIKGFGQKAWDNLSNVDRARLEQLLDGQGMLMPEGMSAACLNWLNDNLELVRIFYKITALYDVPLDDIVKYATVGVLNIPAADAIFKEYFL